MRSPPRPTPAVRLLPGFDQYVLGPGGRWARHPGRPSFGCQPPGGWISPVVLVDGRVQGTWRVDGSGIVVYWFPEADRPPADILAAEIDRIAAILAGHDPAIRVGAPRSPADEGAT